MMSHWTLSRKWALMSAAMLLLASPRAHAAHACDCSAMPSLGSALAYPAMSLWKNVKLSGTVWAEDGNVGLGDERALENGKVSVSGVQTVIQGIYHDPGTVVDVSNGSVNTIVSQDMDGVVADVRAAAAAFAALPYTQSFSLIESSRTITGNGCINVIRITDKISIGSGTLTLTGTADDYFIFNVGDAVIFGGEWLSRMFSYSTRRPRKAKGLAFVYRMTVRRRKEYSNRAAKPSISE